MKKNVTNIVIIVISGFFHGFLSPPFNQSLHPALFFIPAIAIFCSIPFIAVIYDKKPSKLKMYVWGFSSYFGSIWWMALVDVNDLSLLITFGTILLAAFFALKYLALGIISSCVVRKNKKLSFLFVPALWIISEYLFLFGSLSFPWMFEGYLLSQYFYLSQIVSVTGIWGLSFLAVISAVVLYETIFENRKTVAIKTIIIVIVAICLFGFFRIKSIGFYEQKALVLQPNVDQENWCGESSLFASMEVLDSLFETSTELNKGIYIIPESGIFAYFNRHPLCRNMVNNWLEKYDSPIIFGTLDQTLSENYDTISAYNSAFFARLQNYEYKKYKKRKLVPFVETMPFSDIFPLINRLDLAGGSFSAGKENTVWEFEENLKIAPMICYESTYPNFVRNRINSGANFLVNITNDGWFGKTTAPFQHAEMSRVRAIENGVGMIRCANSGISFSVDCYGKYLSKTDLYRREIVEMPIAKPLESTIYRKFGDWFVYLCGLFAIFAFIFPIVRRK
ncbi:MAG: apolipoprotein N-acyltransferase [Chitinispirillales bacterium]|jgi:apolipoprotein N-acyltransferase|nr:apolipoprotein N-acyltransferase [Chitinispirillales bacterium]